MLYNIETSVKAPPSSAELIQKIEQTGRSQYVVVQERLESDEKLVTDLIPLNKVSIWRKKGKAVQKMEANISALKSDCELFRRLFNVCQSSTV